MASLVDVATDFYWHLPDKPASWHYSDPPGVVWQNIQRGLVDLVGPTVPSALLAPVLRSLDPSFPAVDPPGGDAEYASAAALLKTSCHDPATSGSLWQPLSQPIVLQEGAYAGNLSHRQVTLPIDGDDTSESYAANAARWSLYALKERFTASQGPFRVDDISPFWPAYGTDVNAILGNIYQIRMAALSSCARRMTRMLGRMQTTDVHATVTKTAQRVQTAQQQVSAILSALAANPGDSTLRGYLYWWQIEWSNAIAAQGSS